MAVRIAKLLGFLLTGLVMFSLLAPSGAAGPPDRPIIIILDGGERCTLCHRAEPAGLPPHSIIYERENEAQFR